MKLKVKIFTSTLILMFLQKSFVYSSNNIANEEPDIISLTFKLLFYLLVFVGVILLTFYGTKFLAKHSKKIGKTNNIETLEYLNLGNNNKILAIKMYKRIYILAINNNTTTVIDKIDENEIDLNCVESSKQENKFQNQLDSILNSTDDEQNSSLNTKLLGMKMKVLKLKNSQYKEMESKEEEYEKDY